MKRTYIAPSIQVCKIKTPRILAGSIKVGDEYNGDISSAQSKRNKMKFDDYDFMEDDM